MSLLQSPLETLDQIEWFLDNRNLEKFPAAYLTSAGNLCRQMVEYIQLVLAFYSGMPRNKYMRPDGSLKTLKNVWEALNQLDPATSKTYFELARRRGPRIKKFARHPRSLNKWRDQFNEPSHFRNPAANRNTQEAPMREFVGTIRPLVDEGDGLLIICAMNELRTAGRVKAVLDNDAINSPAVSHDVVVRPSDLQLDENGNLSFRTRSLPVHVIPRDKEIPQRWSSGIVIVQGRPFKSKSRVITENGSPIDLTNMQTVIESLMDTPQTTQRILRRLRRLGFMVEQQ